MLTKHIRRLSLMDGKVKLMQAEILVKEKVLCTTEKYFLTYKKGVLIVRETKEIKRIVNKCRIGSFFENIKGFNRLLRKEPRCAVMLDSCSCLISHAGKVMHYNFITNELKVEHEYDKGMKNPLCFCARDLKEGERIVYYGEYIWNGEKGPVSIYKRENANWCKVYEFASKMITHIHNVVWDEKRELFFVLTGDSDSESGIWVSDKDFANVQPLLVGKQMYRACVLFPTEKGFIYATDTPLEKNSLIEVVFNDDKIISIKKIYDMPGSCIYGTKINGKCFFSTTVEPDSSYTGWRYRLTNRLGKGIVDRYSHVIVVGDGEKPCEVFKQRKDRMPMWLFQFGNFLFPYNETDKVIMVSQALTCGHGNSIILK